MKSLISRLSRSPAPRSAADFLARRPAVIAAVALAVFAIVGVGALDDYGVWFDETIQRKIGYASFSYILGDEDALLYDRARAHDWFYGVAFEVPLIAVERLLRLEDSRDMHLSRRLLTHAFFLVGGFFAWLLAYRLFGSRAIALFAMLIFLLHPRLYAHSFFNTKDLPFLSMFMISLYLTHRAFRRDTVRAFALCGVGVGLLVNIRIMGVMLIPAVLGMLALDAFCAMRRGEGGAKRILANICAFSITFAATLYATMPSLWRDPQGVIDGFRTLARHPSPVPTLFRGELVAWPNLPWDYVPTWILITTPPVALALAAVGIVHLARPRAAGWRGALADPTARFGLLAVFCLTAPVVAAVALNPNLYGGWRHMHFLYAPICVLAAFGLRGAAAVMPKRAHRIALYAAVAAALGVVVIQTVRLHPYQNDYFNLFVNRNGAEWLGGRYHMDYVHVSRREALEFLLEAYPDRHISVDGRDGFRQSFYLEDNLTIIPKEERERLTVSRAFADFFISESVDDPIWTREVYGVPIVSVSDVRAESQAAHRAKREYARASQPKASGGGFDVYAGNEDGGGDTLIYVKEPCEEADARARFFVHAFPVRQESLREEARGRDYDAFGFDFRKYGALYDGACVAEYPLPPYPVLAIETGARADGSDSWSAAFALDMRRDAYAATRSAKPAAESDFDIYVDGRTLTYVKEPCTYADARGRFQLWAFPDDEGDLWTESARDGLDFNSLNFDFERYGAIFDGKCVITRTLPSYPMTHVETGQFTDGEGTLWSARITFAAGVERHRRMAAALADKRPAIEADFDVHRVDRALVYIKSPCGADDTRGRFFLSAFPANESDLSDESRARGFAHNALNFDFARYGVTVDGKCVIMRDLPDYPISRVETGQWLTGRGHLWDGTIEVGD